LAATSQLSILGSVIVPALHIHMEDVRRTVKALLLYVSVADSLASCQWR